MFGDVTHFSPGTAPQANLSLPGPEPGRERLVFITHTKIAVTKRPCEEVTG